MISTQKVKVVLPFLVILIAPPQRLSTASLNRLGRRRKIVRTSAISPSFPVPPSPFPSLLSQILVIFTHTLPPFRSLLLPSLTRGQPTFLLDDSHCSHSSSSTLGQSHPSSGRFPQVQPPLRLDPPPLGTPK